MSSTVGRLVVLLLTNQSGGAVANGDLVYIDTGHDNAFITGTTSAYTGMVGVCIEPNGIASSATGRIQVEGLVTLINVNASVTRGHYAKSYTVAKQATDAGASRVTGGFGQFTTGGTTPSIALFGFPDAASSSASQGTPGLTLSTSNSAGSSGTYVGTDATIAAFDATVPVADGTAAAGSAGTAARRDHVHPNTAPGSLLAVVLNTAGGNKTTTSSTQADVDATNAIITAVVPASGKILFRATCTVNVGSSNVNAFLGVRTGSTDLVNGTTGTQVMQSQTAVAGNELVVSWVAYITGLSAGSTIFKLAFAVNGAQTLTVRAAAASPMTLEVWAA